MHDACEELGLYAHSMNGYFAIETGPETAAHLKAFLDTFSTKGVSVNFDPANMVMVTGDDPAAGVRIIKDYIVHTHVKDGTKLRHVDPRMVYGSLGYEPLDHELIEKQKFGRSFREDPVGAGTVDFDRYFAALQEIGYTGYLTVEREGGDTRAADIARAVDFIKRYK
jgi:sugar phosphate isomerase/epimerase